MLGPLRASLFVGPPNGHLDRVALPPPANFSGTFSYNPSLFSFKIFPLSWKVKNTYEKLLRLIYHDKEKMTICGWKSRILATFDTTIRRQNLQALFTDADSKVTKATEFRKSEQKTPYQNTLKQTKLQEMRINLSCSSQSSTGKCFKCLHQFSHGEVQVFLPRTLVRFNRPRKKGTKNGFVSLCEDNTVFTLTADCN